MHLVLLSVFCKTDVDTAVIMLELCCNSDFEYEASKLQSKHFCFCQMCKIWQNQLQLKYICNKLIQEYYQREQNPF